jgi:heterotetrameric sarcosine oxidase gamma subunit
MAKRVSKTEIGVQNTLDTPKIANPFPGFDPFANAPAASGKPGVLVEWVQCATIAELAVFNATSADALKLFDTVTTLSARSKTAYSFRHAHNRICIVSQTIDLLDELRNMTPVETGAVIDQSHGRVCLSIEGDHACDTLSKLFAVDFDVRVFKPTTGIATAHHVIFALIYRETETKFLLFPHRSFARDFLGSLMRAAAEYGVEFEQ